MKPCPHCRAPLPDDAEECHFCRTRLPAGPGAALPIAISLILAGLLFLLWLTITHWGVISTLP